LVGIGFNSPRYSIDEFVVLLLGLGMLQAEEIAQRQPGPGQSSDGQESTTTHPYGRHASSPKLAMKTNLRRLVFARAKRVFFGRKARIAGEFSANFAGAGRHLR
jgi:hypothetical protein